MFFMIKWLFVYTTKAITGVNVPGNGLEYA
jgi:hypothetical protein